MGLVGVLLCILQMRKLSLSEILPTSTQFLSGKAQIQTRLSDYFTCAQPLIINTFYHGIFPKGVPHFDLETLGEHNPD